MAEIPDEGIFLFYGEAGLRNFGTEYLGSSLLDGSDAAVCLSNPRVVVWEEWRRPGSLVSDYLNYQGLIIYKSFREMMQQAEKAWRHG